MYTKNMYKENIFNFIKNNGYDAKIISKETFKIFCDHQKDIDDILYEKLIDIFTMEEGPEFEMTEEEFRKFINKL
jgi:hypothetical protein